MPNKTCMDFLNENPHKKGAVLYILSWLVCNTDAVDIMNAQSPDGYVNLLVYFKSLFGIPQTLNDESSLTWLASIHELFEQFFWYNWNFEYEPNDPHRPRQTEDYSNDGTWYPESILKAVINVCKDEWFHYGCECNNDGDCISSECWKNQLEDIDVFYVYSGEILKVFPTRQYLKDKISLPYVKWDAMEIVAAIMLTVLAIDDEDGIGDYMNIGYTLRANEEMTKEAENFFCKFQFKDNAAEEFLNYYYIQNITEKITKRNALRRIVRVIMKRYSRPELVYRNRYFHEELWKPGGFVSQQAWKAIAHANVSAE